MPFDSAGDAFLFSVASDEFVCQIFRFVNLWGGLEGRGGLWTRIICDRMKRVPIRKCSPFQGSWPRSHSMNPLTLTPEELCKFPLLV